MNANMHITLKIRTKKAIFMKLLKILSICSVAAFATVPALAESGVTDTSILLGTSNAQSGPAAALGTGVSEGIKVYFDKVNAAGGVHGRTISVKNYDDGYEPKKAIRNTQNLIKKDDVFALIGYVGTPTAKAVVPITNRAKIPFFAPFTGAGFLRTPVKENIFNLRASYNDETGAIVDNLVAKGQKKIGLFMQNDSYGKAGQSGVLAGLSKHGLELNGLGTYERNTVDVDAAVAKLKEANPDAVVMVGAYKACAAFMKAAHAAGFKPTFINISFVGTSALIKESGAAGEGSFVSQVVPNPFTSDLEIVKQYRADMSAAGKSPEFTSLEGYVQAAVFVKALKKAGKDLTRDSLKAALNSLSYDLGGLKVAFSKDDHQALKKVYFTKLEGGKPVSVEKF